MQLLRCLWQEYNGKNCKFYIKSLSPSIIDSRDGRAFAALGLCAAEQVFYFPTFFIHNYTKILDNNCESCVIKCLFEILGRRDIFTW